MSVFCVAVFTLYRFAVRLLLPALRFGPDVKLVIGIGLFYAVEREAVGQSACGRNELGLSFGELYFIDEHATFLFAFELYAVCGQRYVVEVGIDFYDGASARAVYKAFAGYVQDGLFRPIRLVDVEAVLARLAVEGHKTFVIHAGLAALVTRVCGKVEHVPYVRAPKIRVTLETLEHIFVIVRLIFFGVIAAFGMFGVQVRHAFRAVLGVGIV